MIATTLRFFAVVCLLLFCETMLTSIVTGNQRTPQVGQEFSIKFSQRLKLEGEDFVVKFTGVPQDSRCPTNVNCVWAGNAEVSLAVNHDKCTAMITLNTHSTSGTGNESKAGGFRVKLIKLEPYPHSEKKISQGDYTATLIVTKE